MNHSSPTPVVRAEALTKMYRRAAEEVRALSDVSFTIRRGEFVAVVGPSGAGKTTRLNLLGCMDPPTTGRLWLEGRELRCANEQERTRLRRDRLGFVFQHFGLVPTLTVAENIALPLLFARRAAGSRVDHLMDRLALAHRRHHRPHELSGGEMQRVAIARALVNEPALLLADEPTGNLDSGTGEAVVRLLHELNAEGLTVVVVTHNAALASTAQRQLRLVDGRLADGAAS